MTKSSVFIIIFSLFIVVGFIGCGDDEGPTTPSISPPTGLTAEPISSGSIALNWVDKDMVGLGYFVERSTGGEWIQVAELEIDIHSFNDSGLEEGTTYQYRVKIFGINFESAASATATATTLPSAPSRLSAERVSTSSIAISWTNVSNVGTGVEIVRKMAGDTSYTSIELAAADVENFTDIGLTPGTEYQYRVRTMHNEQASVWSNVSSAVTTEFTPPVLGGFDVNEVTDTMVRLTWMSPLTDPDGIVIEQSLTGDDMWIADSIDGRETSYTERNLLASTNYFFRGLAYNDSGNSAYTDILSVQTNEGPPVAPDNLEGSAETFTHATLTWRDNSADENGFLIQRKLAAFEGWVDVMTTATNVTTWADSTVGQSVVYDYRINSFNDVGSSDWSASVRISVPSGPPGPPVDFTGSALSFSEVSLSWSSQSPEPIGYIIEQSLTGNDGWSADSVAGIITSYVVSDLNSSTTFYFRGLAYNDIGNSGYTDVISVQTEVGPPNAPDNLEGSAEDHTKVTLTWRDNSFNENGFYTQRKYSTETDWEESVVVAANTTTWDDVTVRESTVYDYRVSSFSDRGSSPWSSTVQVTVPVNPVLPNPPNNFEANPRSYSEIRVTWDRQTPSPTGFIIEISPDGIDEWIADTTNGGTRSWDVSGLDPATTYYFRGSAFNDNGRSEFTDVISAETESVMPSPPENLEAEAAGVDKIRLSWDSVPEDTDGYFIYKRLDEEDEFELINESSALSFTDDGLDPETWYHYKVTAYKQIGDDVYESDFSDEASAQTSDLIAFSDDFEEYEVGEPPNNEAYTIDQDGTSTLRVSDEEVHQGEQSLKFDDSEDGDGNMARLWIETRPLAKGSISFWINLADSGFFGIIGADDEDLITFQLQLQDDNTFAFRDGGNMSFTGEGYPVEEWMELKFEFDFTTHIYNIFFNDEQVTDDPRIQTDQMESNTKLILLGFNNVTIDYVYVDEILFEELPVDDERMGAHRNPILPVGLQKVTDYDSMQLQDR